MLALGMGGMWGATAIPGLDVFKLYGRHISRGHVPGPTVFCDGGTLQPSLYDAPGRADHAHTMRMHGDCASLALPDLAS